MVESVESAQGYQLQNIFTDAITIQETEALRDLKEGVLTHALWFPWSLLLYLWIDTC